MLTVYSVFAQEDFEESGSCTESSLRVPYVTLEK